jgi:hypothetical protein
MFCRSFFVFCLTLENALVWSRRWAKHWQWCFRCYQKRLKTLARFYHDWFSFFNKKEEWRKEFFARKSRFRIEFEARARIKIRVRARAFLWKEEERQKRKKNRRVNDHFLLISSSDLNQKDFFTRSFFLAKKIINFYKQVKKLKFMFLMSR